MRARLYRGWAVLTLVIEKSKEAPRQIVDYDIERAGITASYSPGIR